MIMEKADTSLAKVLKEPCSIEKKKMYILQIAHGLWILRFNGLCHGDLKLDNVLMVDGNCKLADFGLSHFIPTNEMEAKQKFTFGNLVQYVLVLILISLVVLLNSIVLIMVKRLILLSFNKCY